MLITFQPTLVTLIPYLWLSTDKESVLADGDGQNNKIKLNKRKILFVIEILLIFFLTKRIVVVIGGYIVKMRNVIKYSRAVLNQIKYIKKKYMNEFNLKHVVNVVILPNWLSGDSIWGLSLCIKVLNITYPWRTIYFIDFVFQSFFVFLWLVFS